MLRADAGVLSLWVLVSGKVLPRVWRNVNWLISIHGFPQQLVQSTMNGTRIYVFLGAANSLVDFMSSMETAGLFARGEYMVIFVDMMVYSER